MRRSINNLSLLVSLFTLQTGAPKAQDFSPSEAEKAVYLKFSALINQEASKCLQDIWDEHKRFYSKYRISKFYGDRNSALATPTQRIQAIRDTGKSLALAREIQSQQEPISCIGLARRCLSSAIAATQNPELIQMWERLDADVRKNGVSGVFLINHLQKLGWKIYYWNPSPTSNSKWDQEDAQNAPGSRVVSWNTGVRNSKGQFVYNSSWGLHAQRYQSVMKNGTYYLSKVDDRETLVGFEDQMPTIFKKSPLFVGVAHSGYHVFPGLYGQVIEAHSMRKIDSFENLENSPFNPLANGGGPRWTRSEKYRSGLVAVPPGY